MPPPCCHQRTLGGDASFFEAFGAQQVGFVLRGCRKEVDLVERPKSSPLDLIENTPFHHTRLRIAVEYG
ncbi:hypothetical protein PM082_015184 [Marasmius tenuissimus]|nr:hypothetical protein PM082_015184 [Marasmius tenuissimus]